MQTSTKKTLSIYWKHARKYWLSGFFIIFLTIVNTVLAVVVPIYLKKIIDVLSSSPVARAAAQNEAVHYLYIIVFLYLLTWVFWRAVGFLNNYFEVNVGTDLTNTCFEYLHGLSFSFFNDNPVGSLVKKANRFSGSFIGIYDTFLWNILAPIIQIVLIAVVLWKRSFILGIGIFIWFIVFSLVNSWIIKYRSKFDINRNEFDSKVGGILADSITNNLAVKLFNGYKKEVADYKETVGQVAKWTKKSWDVETFTEGIQVLFIIILETGAYFLAIIFWVKGVLTIGDFVLIETYLLSMMNKFWDFSHAFRRLFFNLSDAAEMAAIFDTPPDLVDIPGAKNLQIKGGNIEFKKIKFNYKSTRSVLSNFNLNIKAGERVALVGPSGVGKTTIVWLLSRLFEPTGGKIFIDGRDISKVTQESLRETIGLVPQEPVLFHRTLLENISYGRPEASEEEIKLAANLARAHEFISGLPEGYNTFVGERGIKLSGGERQRVIIARAILRNAPILILDEATSSLDSESEKFIREALDELMKRKTVIAIAHRLSTIMKMDRIVVLDEKGICEEGTHKKLLQKNGLYKKLWDMQVGGFLG